MLAPNDCPQRGASVDCEQGGSGTARAPETIAGETISNKPGHIFCTWHWPDSANMVSTRVW